MRGGRLDWFLNWRDWMLSGVTAEDFEVTRFWSANSLI